MLADLIEGGLGPDERAAVLLSAAEPADPRDARLPVAGRWRLLSATAAEAELPADATHLFIVLDGRANPIDQLEGLKAFLTERGQEVARILCVVHCRLLEQTPKLLAWYEACIHFSDVVLLNRREGVPNKWIGDFQARFTSRFFPCTFEFVRDGKVKNPALVLAPVARRISHFFDEAEWVAVDDEDEEEMEDGDEVEVRAEVDPYLERRHGGRRVHELPHIADYLPPPDGATAG